MRSAACDPLTSLLPFGSYSSEHFPRRGTLVRCGPAGSRHVTGTQHYAESTSVVRASCRFRLLQRQSRESRVRCQPAVAETVTHTSGDVSLSLPRTPVEMVRQASETVQRGIQEGRKRFMLQFLLPTNEKEYDFLATEACDYPCSIAKEFDKACAVTRSFLQQLLGASVVLKSQRIDEGGVEGDPCAVIYTENKEWAAVVYPTADRLNDLRALAKVEERRLLIINPQWREEGQIISDFGFGPWRKAAVDFLDTFTPCYTLTEQRVGAPSSIVPATGERFVQGGVVRLLRAYPSGFQVFAMASNGSNQLLTEFEHKPSYQQLEKLLEEAKAAKLEIFKIARVSSNVYAERLQAEGAGSNSGIVDEADPEPVADEQVSGDDIDAMDAVTLRRYLGGMNLPTSGKMSKLRQRLKTALGLRSGGESE